jgi:hypothetical protein
MAPASPAPKDSPVPIVKRNRGMPSAPKANKTTHPPKQTALIARSVILRGERFSRQSEFRSSVVFIISTWLPPNAHTEAFGAPATNSLQVMFAGPILQFRE